MGQINYGKQKPRYCNLVAIQTGGSKADTVLANGEIWLVDTTNATKVNGTGVYDAYIKGDGSTAAKNLTVEYLTARIDLSAYSTTAQMNAAIQSAVSGKQDSITTVNVTIDNNTGTPSGSASVSGGTLTLDLKNLKGADGSKGDPGSQGIQGVQGPQGPKGDTGVTGDASSLTIIHGIDKTTSYAATDVCGADAAQALLNEIEGGFYY